LTKPFTEYKKKLNGEVVKFECTLVKWDEKELIIVYKLPKGVSIFGNLLPPESISYAYYWSDKSYNVYHWVGPDRQTKLVYVNIADSTTITENSVTWRDLIVDIIIYPTGIYAVLDEIEIPESLDPSLKKVIEETKDEVVRKRFEILAYVNASTRKFLYC
jgi:predicted RNA-binding protein associated with RNAse of E/G family